MKNIVAPAALLACMLCACSCGSGTQIREESEFITGAVDRNDTVMVRSMLDEGFEPDHAFTDGWRLLHIAARWDSDRVLRLCFDAGNGTPAAGNADRAREKALEMVTLLVSRHADVNSKTADGNTPLHIALLSLNRDAADFPSVSPVKGRISSRFGWRGSPFDNTSDYHRGLDISAKNGTPVCAAADGVVSMTGMNDVAGNYIVVQHGNGLQTVYGHCHLFAVRKNARVRRGDTIGYVGRSGAVSGDHCHYEVRLNGAPVDPLSYMHHKEICDIQFGIISRLVEMLLSNKAAVDIRNKAGRTPLIEGAGKSAAISRVLVEHGADVNAKDGSGITPLHAAAACDAGLVRFLLERGAEVNPRTTEEYCAIGGLLYRSGSTPLTVAQKSGNTAIADLLKLHGAIE